jgi:hypothetical protein
MNIKIVAAIVDTRQLTLYKEDGETILIKQGDQRLRPILEQVTPQIVARGYAMLDMSMITVETGFQQFEKQSGVVRFFKVAREKLAGLFAAPHVDAAVVGKRPTMVIPDEHGLPEVQGTQAVIDEIMAHAQPVSAADFTTDNIAKQGKIVEDDGTTKNQRDDAPSSHTIVAQVNGRLIPNMERIETHFARAAKLGNPKGVELFLQRLASVIDERSHSVEDLLKFMERADMPIADDGSVVIYKVLRRQDGHYVDCHTKKVPQKVGSYVCMDIGLVDRNRNNECSNGLHVARRGYISGFSGDVCVIAKLAPEDVITVPTYDANKMRVMGYHIVHELPADLYALLKRNRPISELEEGKDLLGRILAGQHVGRLEEVRITEQRGGGIVVTPITKAPKAVTAPKVKTPKAAPAEALANPEKEKEDAPLNPKEVVKKVATLSRKEQAQKLFKAYQKNPTKKNKEKLVAYKKSVKQGWKALGIDESLIK